MSKHAEPRRRPARYIPISAAGLLVATSCAGEDPGPPPALRLRDATASSGLEFRHVSGASAEHRLPEVMGAGCALFDADGDGDLDLYLTQGVGPNRLFANQGDGSFRDATAQSGLGDEGYGMGIAVGDVEGDGDLDLYVSNFGADRLYRNRGDGSFEDVTAQAGLADSIELSGWSTSATFFDADGDGLLDLWVVRYVSDDDLKRCSGGSGRPDYCNPKAFPAQRDVLLRNRGGWRFEDASAAAGLHGVPAAAGLGVISFDVDRDGRQDIVVANDGYPNHIWINGGDGTLREAAAELGAAYDSNGAAEAGMGITVAQLGGDAGLDLFLTHLAGETNTLYVGGERGFQDTSAGSGLGLASVPYTGFGVAAFDADLDGDLDLAIANGRVLRATPHPACALGPPWDEYAEPNSLYENRGGTFELLPGAWLGGAVEVSRGLAAGDVDGDGDIDLLSAQIDGPTRLWLNESRRAGKWLAVRALDGARVALGAEVRIESVTGAQVRLVTRSSSYLSCGSPLAHFGLSGAAPERVVVRWPDGNEEQFEVGALERVLVVRRGEGQAP